MDNIPSAAPSARPKSNVYRLNSITPREHSSVLERWRPHRPWRRYGLSILLVGGATLLGQIVGPVIAPTNLVMIYLAIVVVAAIYLGRGPSALAAVLGVLAFDFFLVPPRLTLAVADTQYLLTFVTLLTVGLVISTLTARVREQANNARRHQIETMELYGFSRDLAGSFDWKDILQFILDHVGKTFSAQVVVFLPERGVLEPVAFTPGLVLDKDESYLANYCFQQGQAMGRGSRIPLATTLFCMPLKTSHGSIGVLGIKSPPSHVPVRMEQYSLLEAFSSQAALALERAEFAEQAKKAEVLQSTEKLQTALLNSISHDLRTPLVSITGALSSLLEDGINWDDPTRQTMIETAYDDARRLNHLVGDLLDITRIEAGAMQMTREPCDVQDVIGSALNQLSDRLKEHPVAVELPNMLPLVPMNFVLMLQVLVNLLENAVKYSPAGQPIEIKVRIVECELEIEISDRGIGIPHADIARVFDKFYRVRRRDGVMGTGLGLAICKGIVEAHHGRISAANRDGGGTVIALRLPLESGETHGRA